MSRRSILASSLPAVAVALKTPPAPVVPLLLDARAASILCGFSVPTLHRRHGRGEFPAAVRIGRCTRWRRADLEAWIAGLPAGGAE